MYNIDLSFLSDTKLIEGSLHTNQVKYNNIYKDLIAAKINTTPQFEQNIENYTIDILPETLDDEREIIEISCKGLIGSKFCFIPAENKFVVNKDDIILIEVGECIEVAVVCEVGEIVQLKRKIYNLANEELPRAVGILGDEDIQKYNKNIEDEINAVPVFRERVEKFELNMKLVDVHYQFDRKKLYFYYTSDGRVDFRDLAKDLASQFKTRIELRQIGVRDEAKRVGGLGTCGREFCCSSFLNNFKRITTQIANEQNLSSNMSKLSGPCGKLKCCLSFELD